MIVEDIPLLYRRMIELHRNDIYATLSEGRNTNVMYLLQVFDFFSGLRSGYSRQICQETAT